MPKFHSDKLFRLGLIWNGNALPFKEPNANGPCNDNMLASHDELCYPEHHEQIPPL